jgi:endonuclease/exonuclease/phosphatase (EEP) superfamily protein YafD
MGLSDEDTLTQITEAVNFIAGRTPAVFGGDFNAEPDSQVAQIVKEAGFVDPFVALGIDPPPLTDPAINPTARIDFVWVRGLTPIHAQVPASLASDHRMVVVEVQP